MSTGKLNDIQWLRAIAAIEVIIWHSDLITKHFSPYMLHASNYKQLGGIGVELFFVISGYVICLRAPTYETAFKFMQSRVYRLFPLYWFFTSLVLLAYVVDRNWNLHGLPPDAARVLKSYFILPQWDVPVFGLGWTLELEMVFYAIVAVVFWASAGLSAGIKKSIALLLGALGLVGFIIGTGPSRRFWDFHLLSPYLLAFGYGWLVRVVEEQGGWRQQTDLVGAFAAISLMALFAAKGLDRDVTYHIVLSAALFSLFRHFRDVFEAANSLNRTMALVGDASYSLYLSHWFVLSIGGKLLAVVQPTASMDLLFRVIGSSISIGVGVLLFVMLERPIDRLLRATPRRRGIVVSS